MVLLVGIDDFVGEFNVPNLTGMSPAIIGNQAELERFIAIYQREYLMQILQPTLYDAFMTGLENNNYPAQRWRDLKAVLQKSDDKVSPITGYIYYHWARNRVTQTAALGEVVTNGENATVVVGEKMMRAYNHSVHAGEEVYEWLVNHADDYPEFDSYAPYPLKPINSFGL